MRRATSGNIATPATLKSTIDGHNGYLLMVTAWFMWVVSAGAGCQDDNQDLCGDGSCNSAVVLDASSEGSNTGAERLDASTESALGAESTPGGDAFPPGTATADASPSNTADPCETDAPAATAYCGVSESNGVFVAPDGNDETGAGTRAQPYRTLRKALAMAGISTRRVYACDNGAGYSESVEIGPTIDGLQMYGGFDCQSWTYDPLTPSRVAAAQSTALTISNITTGITIEGFAFKAGPGMRPSENSIGLVLINSSNVTLRRVEIAASPGADGAPGQNGGGSEDLSAPSGNRGNPGVAACTPMTIEGGTGKTSGGASVTTICGAGSTNGGAGGTGGVYTGSGTNGVPPNTPGGAGMSGAPQNDAGAGAGQGGVGETNATGRCSAGTDGATGVDGRYGLGARGLGALEVAGWTGPAGAAGEPGLPGSGGGGGGGAKAPVDATACQGVGPSSRTGASGGSGGAGGCGGQPGAGGKAGGSSIAVVSVDTTGFVLESCTLRPGVGGKGGNGGKGQAGGTGGAAGIGGLGLQNQSFDACTGGVGGRGGNGGPGGGGLGGHSIGIASKGTAPTRLGGTITTSSGGPGGLAGGGVSSSAEYAAGRGENGRSMAEVAF